MKVALLAADSKIPNLALMKLSAWHKAQGDSVEIYSPISSLLSKPDICYASKVFSFSPDPEYLPDCEIVYGGTGHDLKVELPPEIEAMCPDYEIFNCNYALGFTTRGCIRKCPFCIVPEKEGKIRAVSDIYAFWRGQKEIKLLDNNILTLPDHFFKICGQIKKEGIKVDFNQGLDIRLLTESMVKTLKELRHDDYRFAFDFPEMEDIIREKVALLEHYGIHRSMFYVLVGFNTTIEQDIHRLNVLRELGQNAYVMRYKREKIYIPLANWANQPRVFHAMDFESFLNHPEKRHYKKYFPEVRPHAAADTS